VDDVFCGSRRDVVLGVLVTGKIRSLWAGRTRKLIGDQRIGLRLNLIKE